MTDQFVSYETNAKAKTARITLRRPDKLNAISASMALTMRDYVNQANADDTVNIIIIDGEGPSFTSGGDASEIHTNFESMSGGTDAKGIPTQRARMSKFDLWWGRAGLYQTVLFSPKATIVEAKGYCYGAGLYLCLCGWFVVASETAVFTSPAWRYFGPCGDMSLLIYTMGLKRAKEFIFRGMVLDAKTALRNGIVDSVVPADQLQSEMDRLIELHVTLPRDTRAAKKVQVNAGLENIQIGSSFATAIACDGLLANLRLRENEFNFLKERKYRGLPGAFEAEETHFRTPLKVL